jgi:uncharacterized protein YnzC (UPF0291/DUF896 family)
MLEIKFFDGVKTLCIPTENDESIFLPYNQDGIDKVNKIINYLHYKDSKGACLNNDEIKLLLTLENFIKDVESELQTKLYTVKLLEEIDIDVIPNKTSPVSRVLKKN